MIPCISQWCPAYYELFNSIQFDFTPMFPAWLDLLDGKCHGQRSFETLGICTNVECRASRALCKTMQGMRHPLQKDHNPHCHRRQSHKELMPCSQAHQICHMHLVLHPQLTYSCASLRLQHNTASRQHGTLAQLHSKAITPCRPQKSGKTSAQSQTNSQGKKE